MHLRKTRLAALAGIAALALAACGGSSTTTTSSSAAAPAGSAASGSAAASSAPAAGDTAGASAAPAASTEGALTIWASAQYAPILTEVSKQFTADNGIPVNVQSISGAQSVQSQFITASQAGTGPDLVIEAHDGIGNMVQNGAIDPIPMTDTKKSEFLPTAIDGVTFNGQVYGVPFAVENLALFRNTDLAPTAPATMEDLVASGEALKSAGKVSEVLGLQQGQNGDAYHLYPLFTSAGGSVFAKNADGSWDPKQLQLGSPESIAAMQKIQSLGETGQNVLKRSIEAGQIPSLFTDQKTAYMITGPWNLPAVQKSGVKYAIDTIPGFAGMGPAAPFIGVQAMYVASKSKNKAVAQEYATNFFATPAVATAIFKDQPRPPALKAVYEEVAASNPDVKAFVEAGANSSPMPNITAMALTFDPWGKADAAIIGGADPAATMTAAAAAIQAQIK
jgi:arabinogalactan oligomer/maltooligosaccharide transport system substrate-binding protein